MYINHLKKYIKYVLVAFLFRVVILSVAMVHVIKSYLQPKYDLQFEYLIYKYILICVF